MKRRNKERLPDGKAISFYFVSQCLVGTEKQVGPCTEHGQKRVRASRLVLCCANRIRLAFVFVGVGQWRLRQQASSFAFYPHRPWPRRQGRPRRPSPFVWLVGSQPASPGCPAVVTRQAHGAVTEDNRAWRRRIPWDGRTDGPDRRGGASLASWPARRGTEGNVPVPVPTGEHGWSGGEAFVSW